MTSLLLFGWIKVISFDSTWIDNIRGSGSPWKGRDKEYSLLWMYVFLAMKGDRCIGRCSRNLLIPTDIQFSLHHPASVKSGVIECLVDQAIIVSSEKTLLKQELDHMKDDMVQNRYPEILSRRPKTRG